MNAVVEMKPSALAVTHAAPGHRAVAEIIEHVKTVQEVMRAVMKPDVHYGVIPGTDKPTLLKPGAELLCMTFRIADRYVVEDLSADGFVRYRVTCIGEHQTTGTVLGTGMGEASSGEEKYKWRRATSPQEFEETPTTHRRTKHVKKRNGDGYSIQQVRTEHADLANTILKMANKRAKMAMVLNVTAASDCFSQDLEDMDEVLRDHLSRNGEEPPEVRQQAAPAGPAPWPDDALDKRRDKVPDWQKAGKTADEVIEFLAAKGTLSEDQKARVRGWFAPAAPVVTYAQLADRLNRCDDVDTAALIVDEGRALPADQQSDLAKLYAAKFNAQE